MKLRSKIKLAWDRLWVRKIKYKKCLGFIMLDMTPEDFESYQKDLDK